MFIKVYPSEVFIIERLGKFYKTVTDDTFFLVPFIDKVRNRVSLEKMIHETQNFSFALSDDIKFNYKFKIFYYINDPIKATYKIKNLRLQLDFLIIKKLKEIVSKFECRDIEEFKEIVKKDLNSELNREIQSLGLVIEDIDIKFLN